MGRNAQLSLWLFWTVGVSAAVFATFWRWQIERQYRTVALVLDGNEVRTLHALTGKTLDELLRELKRYGANAISIPAELLSDWVQKGKVKVEGNLLFAHEFETLNQVRTSLNRQFGWDLPEPKRIQTGWQLPLPSLEFLTLPIHVGLAKDLAEKARKVGLTTIARLPNPTGLTEIGIKFWVEEIRSIGALFVIFEGEEVFGFRTLLMQVADEFKRTNCQIGILELVTQKGDKVLATMLPERVVRVHSISSRELINFSQPELVDRFVRAVRERNIRLCYVHFPFHIKGEPLAIAADYLSSLRAELERRGFEVGVPLPMPQVSTSVWLWVLVCLGAVTTGVAFLSLFVPLSSAQQFRLTILGLMLGLVLFLLNSIWAAKLTAFGIAVVAPILAIWLGAKQTLKSGSRWRRALMGIATCLGFTILCGLIESAVMFDHRFWLKVSEFSGVKVSQLLPFIMLVVMIFAQWFDTSELEFSERYQVARGNFHTLFETSVKWGQAIALLFLLAAVAYWIMRTGNEPGVGVPMWEIKLRATIEDILGVRPRFKEFLIGHPALVLAFFFLTGTHLETKIGQWLTVPAIIGLSSVMNTFSHAHTPIAFSLLRTFHGIWLGVIIGVLLVWVAKGFSAARDLQLKNVSDAKSKPAQAKSSRD